VPPAPIPFALVPPTAAVALVPPVPVLPPTAAVELVPPVPVLPPVAVVELLPPTLDLPPVADAPPAAVLPPVAVVLLLLVALVPPTEPPDVPPAVVLPPVAVVLVPVWPPVSVVDVEVLPPTLLLGPELEPLLPQPTTIVPKTSVLSLIIFVVRIESSDCGGQSSPQFSIVTGHKRPRPSYSPGIGSCTGSKTGEILGLWGVTGLSHQSTKAVRN
jgi:hypothetical protein